MEKKSPIRALVEAESMQSISFGVEDRGDAETFTSDRLVPSRGTCNSMSQMRLEKNENWAPKNEYHEVLSHNVLGKELLSNVKVLSYKHKPQSYEPVQNELRVLYSSNRDGPKPKPTRVVQQNAIRVLDAPNLEDDFYAHPVDWSHQNVIAVALSDMVFLFDADSGRIEKLLTLSNGTVNDNVTTLRWTGEGAHVCVGTAAGNLQIWDGLAQRQLRTLRGHASRIGAVAWNEHMLSSGGGDGEVHHHDVRVREHIVGKLVGAHVDLVCGLDYSNDGVLASGGNDNMVCIWDNATSKAPLYKFTDHKAAVKAVKWCPWQRNMLVTGGGSSDRQVCLWNASSGRLAMAIDAESQVTDVLWGKHERELVTAHGYSRNQLSLWKYPSLLKTADLEGHTGRLLGLAQSPCGSIVCSASADETLRFWRVFSPIADEKKGRDRVDTPLWTRTIR